MKYPSGTSTIASLAAAACLLALACTPRDVAIPSRQGAASDTAVGPGAGLTAVAERGIPQSVSAFDTLWLIARDSPDDGVRATDTEDSLVARYGAANVRRDWVDQGEGMLVDGTILFPDDPERLLEIQWKDTVGRSGPLVVFASGRRWMIAPGLGIGTTLQEIERMNGRPFRLSEFRGHYPGTVVDWTGGQLAGLSDPDASGFPRTTIRLQPKPPFPPGVDLEQFEKDTTFSSSDPDMRRLNPRVVYIAVSPR